MMDSTVSIAWVSPGPARGSRTGGRKGLGNAVGSESTLLWLAKPSALLTVEVGYGPWFSAWGCLKTFSALQFDGLKVAVSDTVGSTCNLLDLLRDLGMINQTARSNLHIDRRPGRVYYAANMVWTPPNREIIWLRNTISER